MSAATADALRLFAVAYLLLTGLGFVLGRWRPLVAFPVRTVYSTLRLALLVLTAKRVRMVPLEARRRSSKLLRRHAARRARPRSSAALDASDWRSSDTAETDAEATRATVAFSPAAVAAAYPLFHLPVLDDEDDESPIRPSFD